MRNVCFTATLAFVMASTFACGTFESPVRTLVLPADGIAAPYDFDGVRTALAERGVVLSIPTAAEAARAIPIAAYEPILRQQLTTQPEAEIVSIHLAVANKGGNMLPLDDALAYVVETTGHDTGNCISLNDAATGVGILAACFFPGRSRP
jgi:hypothetical protein